MRLQIIKGIGIPEAPLSNAHNIEKGVAHKEITMLWDEEDERISQDFLHPMRSIINLMCSY